MQFRLFLILFAVVGTVRSLVVVDSTLASACMYYMNTFDWGCTAMAGMGHSLYGCRCKNLLYLGSVSTCIMEQNNSTRLQDHALRHLLGRCEARAGITLTLDEMKAWKHNASAYLRYPTLEDLTTAVDAPLLTNTTEWEYYHKSFKDFAFEVQKSQWFGWGLVFFWATVMAILTIVNLASKVFSFKLVSNSLQRNLTIPAAFGKDHEDFFWLLHYIPLQVPTRINGIIVTLFILQTIITSCVGYTLSMPNAFINDRYFMNLDLISYRTDMMLISLFPIIYLFGIRNNFFIPITGIPFSTFQFYHKWCAIVMVCLAFVHAIIWTVDAIKEGGYLMWYLDLYFQHGIAAMTIGALLLFQSFKIVRDVLYEVFLVFHGLFNVFFIVTMYYHCNTLGWLGWIWSMAGIWVFDRVVRFIRCMLNGGIQKTTLTLHENDVIRLEVSKPKFMSFKPGSYAFVYFLTPCWYLGWQSHPFTVINCPVSKSENGKLTVYFKLKKGITHRLLQRLAKGNSSTNYPELDVRILMEGPYGGESVFNSVDKYVNRGLDDSKFLGVAGGLGVVSVFPHFVSLLKNKVSLEKGDSSSTESKFTSSGDEDYDFETEKIKEHGHSPDYKLVWVISHAINIAWFKDELKWLISKGCEVQILVTGKESASKLKEAYGESDSFTKDLQENIVYLAQRPLFADMVDSSYEDASSESRSLTIFACGPNAFNDDLRCSVVSTLKKHKDLKTPLNYNAECFSW